MPDQISLKRKFFIKKIRVETKKPFSAILLKLAQVRHLAASTNLLEAFVIRLGADLQVQSSGKRVRVRCQHTKL